MHEGVEVKLHALSLTVVSQQKERVADLDSEKRNI